MNTTKTYNDLLQELEQTRLQLQEANGTIDAIRFGEVDALILENEKGHELLAIKSLNQTYRLFLEKLQEGAITISEEGIILYSNSAFASMMNMPLAKMTGIPVIDFVPAEYRNAFTKIINEGWQSDCKGEVSFIKENQLAPFLLSVTSIELDECRALSIIFTDLTFQKDNERKLQIKNEQLEEARKKTDRMNVELEDIVKVRTNDLLLSMERFKFLADNTPVIIWTLEPGGAANYFNKLWYEYTGLTVEESEGSRSQQVLHPDDYELMVNSWANAIKNQTQFQHEYRIKRADGKYRWHMGTIAPLKNEAGNTVTWIGTATDIESQKKEIEKKDEFISIASHEMRTPLTTANAYLQLIELSLKKDNDNINIYAKKARQSVSRLSDLVSELLDVSKIQYGKLKYNIATFNFNEIINDTIEDIQAATPKHSIVKSGKVLNEVTGDRDRLQQVIINLLSNAIKYSPDGENIFINAEQKNDEIKVSVKDNGIGISPDNIEKIFTRYYQVSGLSIKYQGLGIGLYISNEIIQRHGGKLWAESEPGKGSTFYFTIPVKPKNTMNDIEANQ